MDVIDTKILVAIITALGVIIGPVLVWLAKKRQRSWELDNKRIEELEKALNTIDELAKQHIHMIVEVVTPISREGNLSATFERYDDFVNNPDLPTEYEAARGFLLAACSDAGSKSLRDKLSIVIQELHNFQFVGFLLKQSSWAIADAMEHALELWKELAPGIDSDKASILRLEEDVKSKFGKALDELTYLVGAEPPEPMDNLRTQDDVIGLVREFCRQWQRSAEMTLYNRLHRAIGELRYTLRSEKRAL